VLKPFARRELDAAVVLADIDLSVATAVAKELGENALAISPTSIALAPAATRSK